MSVRYGCILALSLLASGCGEQNNAMIGTAVGTTAAENLSRALGRNGVIVPRQATGATRAVLSGTIATLLNEAERKQLQAMTIRTSQQPVGAVERECSTSRPDVCFTTQRLAVMNSAPGTPQCSPIRKAIVIRGIEQVEEECV